jgi:GPH family glycoside/pentoside/hexuronide:cation symporter
MNTFSQKLSVAEKIGYSLGDLAANLVFQTLLTFLAFFYTDVYGLKPEVATPIIFFVGLFAALVFNPIIGALADRTNSRWGKFRPWILWTAVPLGIISLLAFSTPNFSESGKVIYAIITYTLLLFFYAANNLPYAALSGVITGDMAERNSISSYRFVAVMVAQFVVQVFMYPFVDYMGGGDRAVGFSKVMTYLAATGTIMLLITFFTTKERIVPTPEQKSSLKDDFTDLSNNRPWVIMLVLTILVFITLALKGGTYVYYFENYLSESHIESFLNNFGFSVSDNPASYGFSVFNAGGIIFMIVGIMFSKPLADKYGKRNVFGIALFLSTLFILVFYFFPPDAIALVLGSQILHGFFYGITIPILWAMIADVADYSEWKNNRRATAIIFSAMMVGLKLGLTFGGALITGILGSFGYSAEAVTQTPEAINGIKLSVSVFPATFFFIGASLLFFYEIDKKMEDLIENDLKLRRSN